MSLHDVDIISYYDEFILRQERLLARAQPLLADPRKMPLSILDIPEYKLVKKPWKKGLVISDKMDKSATVMVAYWATAWNGALQAAPAD